MKDTRTQRMSRSWVRDLELKKLDHWGRFQLQVTENATQNCLNNRLIGAYIRKSRYSEGFSPVGSCGSIYPLWYIYLGLGSFSLSTLPSDVNSALGLVPQWSQDCCSSHQSYGRVFVHMLWERGTDFSQFRNLPQISSLDINWIWVTHPFLEREELIPPPIGPFLGLCGGSASLEEFGLCQGDWIPEQNGFIRKKKEWMGPG